MTIDEANEKAKCIAKLNLDMWHTSSRQEQAKLKEQLHATWMEIQREGFKIRHKKVFDARYGYRIPYFWVNEDHSEDLVNIVDNRDANGYNKGDCTTRCISFCTGVDYMTIQKEQFANAAKMHSKWRQAKVWKLSLLSRGFFEIDLPRKISRKTFLKVFGNCGIDEGIIATKSSGHVAAIDMKTKKVLDLFNSTGGRITTIFVPNAQKYMWMAKINAILG